MATGDEEWEVEGDVCDVRPMMGTTITILQQARDGKSE
jgi:hypothetical protein